MEDYNSEDRKVIDNYYDHQIPTVIMLSVFGVVGVLGNSIIMIVYWKLPKMTTTQFLIFVIAIFDFLTALVTVPLKITQRYYWFEFLNIKFCKAQWAFADVLVVPSAVLLLVVSFIRYCHVCKPNLLRFLEPNIKIIYVVSVMFGLIYGIMDATVAGKHKWYDHHGRQLPGYKCFIADSHEGGFFATYIVFYSKMAGVLFIWVALVFLNCSIIINYQIRKKANKTKQVVSPGVEVTPEGQRLQSTLAEAPRSSNKSRNKTLVHFFDQVHEVQSAVAMVPQRQNESFNNTADAALCNTPQKPQNSGVRPIKGNQTNNNKWDEALSSKTGTGTFSIGTSNTRGNRGNTDSAQNFKSETTESNFTDNETDWCPVVVTCDGGNGKEEDNASLENHNSIDQTFRKLDRTTIMLCIVSLSYIFTYLPWFLLAIYVKPSHSADVSPNLARFVIFPGRHLYLLGCAFNPIIYTFVNPSFRSMCRALFVKRKNGNRHQDH